MRSIRRLAGKAPPGYSKAGDDVAVVPVGKGRLVMKVDMLVEDTDVPPGMSYRQAARKAVAMCVSDFAAKGVKPESFMVSLGLKRGVSQAEIDGLAEGLRDAEREWQVRLIGGDTNESQELVIDCAMVGFARKIVPRDGAAAGDVLLVTGPFGFQPAGLKIFVDGARGSPAFVEVAKRSVLEPRPSIKIGIALAPFLTSAIDSSDGLARSIHALARESGVGFEVTCIPLGEGVEEFARSNGFDPARLALEGGEEYVIVGTAKKSTLGKARAAARRAGGGIIEVGMATSRRGVVELKTASGVVPIRDVGWTHLG